MKLPVYYIRHGQSVWNKEQGEARASGTPEPQVRAMGDELRFTDAPLSAKGVTQALALRHRLFADGSEGALPELLHCVISGQGCAVPRLFTSNLRRAIDTGLLGLRPLLESANVAKSARFFSLPALQETCHYADCAPLTCEDPLRRYTRRLNRDVMNDLDKALRKARGEAIETADDAVPVASIADEDEANATEALARKLVPDGSRDRPSCDPNADHNKLVLDLQKSQFDEVAPHEWDYLKNEAYLMWLRLANHEHLDDRRRFADGQSLTAAVQLPGSGFEAATGPLVERMGDILSALMPDGKQRDAPPAAIIAAHSRILREWLFLFHSNRLHAPVQLPGKKGKQNVTLLWDEGSVASECAALAQEDSRLSNCGVVAFDLDVCDGGDACLEGATITLRNCILDAGSQVTARMPTKHPEAPPSATNLAVAGVLVLMALGLLLLRVRAGVNRRDAQATSKRRAKKD